LPVHFLGWVLSLGSEPEKEGHPDKRKKRSGKKEEILIVANHSPNQIEDERELNVNYKSSHGLPHVRMMP